MFGNSGISIFFRVIANVCQALTGVTMVIGGQAMGWFPGGPEPKMENLASISLWMQPGIVYIAWFVCFNLLAILAGSAASSTARLGVKDSSLHKSTRPHGQVATRKSR